MSSSKDVARVGAEESSLLPANYSHSKRRRPWKRFRRFRPRATKYGSLESSSRIIQNGDENENQDSSDPTSPSSFNESRHAPQYSFRGEQGVSQDSNGSLMLVVSWAEATLRFVVVMGLCFLAGVYFSDWVRVASKVTEYAAVAWATCLVLLLASALVQRKTAPALAELQTEEEDDLAVRNMEEQRPLLSATSSGRFDEDLEAFAVPNLEGELQQRRLQPGCSFLEDETKTPQGQPACVHPSLEPYFVIDVSNGKRVFPNTTRQTHSIDSDYFHGQMMVLIRTPDVDDPAVPGAAPNAAAAAYLSPKQRRFEFQFQIRLKKVPTGRVYFACELNESVKMGLIQRAFVSAAMAFVKTTNSSFHYSITGTTPVPGGRYEKPHMAFPVEEGMNRLVATKPGQVPPALGEEIVEDVESIKRRKKELRYPWNLEDTYTLSLWSAYVDFLDWRCINLPGIRPFGIRGIIGRQPIHLTLYEIPDMNKNKNHYRCDMIHIAEFEMNNAPESGLGECAKSWLAMYNSGGSSGAVPPKLQALPDVETDGNESVDEQLLLPTDDAREVDDEDYAAAELGEGIYVRSGDVVLLGESVRQEDKPCFVVNGGGFAVLQEQSASSTIIIEKAGRSRSKRNSARASLIRSGDAVVFKLVTKGKKKGGEKPTVKYLALHRGWWLKWIAAVPTKNGFFTIHTNENNMDDTQPQSLYLTFGGSFFLKHKRWSKYLVGAAREASPAYGGRILGLYNKDKESSRELDFNTDDEEIPFDQPDLNGKQGERWIEPLLLALQDVTTKAGTPSLGVHAPALQRVEAPSGPRFVFSSADYTMDAPAWLEVMNRADRVRQLVYVLRVRTPGASTTESLGDESKLMEDELAEPAQKTFMRLRTGRELSQIMRVGLGWRNDAASPKQRRRKLSADSRESQIPRSLKQIESMPSLVSDLASVQSGDQVGELDDASSAGLGTESFYELDLNELNELGDEMDGPNEASQARQPNKGRKLIGKIAKSMKTRTATTGKTVVRRSVKVGKGTVHAGKATVNAGKAMISGRPKNPPSQPKAGKARSRRKVERDLRVSVSTKALRRVERVEARQEPNLESGAAVAGELSAPEESCRTVSNMLSRMSTVSQSSPAASDFSLMLAAQADARNEIDATFLQGGSVELGIEPRDVSRDKGPIVFDCVVARCLWESHWREEWFRVQQKGVQFYAPLTKVPCLDVAIKDILGVRAVNPGIKSPLPGSAVLAIETAWICHYIAFGSQDARESAKVKLKELLEEFEATENPPESERDIDLFYARLWQGLQNSFESGHVMGKGKWADVPSGQKRKSRFILNNRRLSFDPQPPPEDIERFVEGLLSSCLSFTLDSLQRSPEELSKFL